MIAPVLAIAIDRAGGIKALARRLGITHNALYCWKQVPADRVLEIEAISGISRYEIRPDVFGSEETLARGGWVRADDIDAVVTAMQTHLAAGRVGFAGLYAQHQMDYAGAYHAVCELSPRWNNAGPTEHDERHVRELRGLINELGHSRVVAPDVYAINTTFHGKATAFQDHAPRVAA